MKALITLILVLFFAVLAVAQDTPSSTSIVDGATKAASLELVVPIEASKDVPGANSKSIARLYRFRNYRVLKELNFTTKKNKAKLA